MNEEFGHQRKNFELQIRSLAAKLKLGIFQA